MECIESVLSQTYSNWRYLIADNCSTDGTAEVARTYSERDPRIRFHQFTTYETVIRNWNRTLTLLDPEAAFCKFVLADDWLYPECLKRMVELALRHPSIGVVGAYRIQGTQVGLDVISPDVEVVSGRDVCHDHLVGREYVLGSPTSLLLRADLVRDREPEFFYEANLDGTHSDGLYVNFHADTDAFLALLTKADFGFVHQVLSFTRVHEESITSKWTARQGTWLPGHLLTLLRYGSDVLEREEFDRRLRTVVRRYEWMLLRSAMRGRFLDPTFRSYHREAMKRIRSQFKLAEVQADLSVGVFSALLGA